MRIIAVIQARMGSTRLPGKVMKKLCGKTVLEHVVERVRLANNIDDIVIATTTCDQDDIIATEVSKYGVQLFRGSECDVLERYYLAAKENKADAVVRITSDCPLIDPIIIDQMTDLFKKEQYDLVTNAGSNLKERTYPRGLDTEVFSFNALEEAFNGAREQHQREHVTPFIYETSSKIYYYKNSKDFSMHRWTLDTNEDFILIQEVYRHLYKGRHDFYLFEILQLLEQYPELIKINAHIEQKKL